MASEYDLERLEKEVDAENSAELNPSGSTAKDNNSEETASSLTLDTSISKLKLDSEPATDMKENPLISESESETAKSESFESLPEFLKEIFDPLSFQTLFEKMNIKGLFETLKYQGFVPSDLKQSIEERVNTLNIDKTEYNNKINSTLVLFMYGGTNLQKVFAFRKFKFNRTLNSIKNFLIDMKFEFGQNRNKKIDNNTVTISRIISLYSKEYYYIRKLAKSMPKNSNLNKVLNIHLPDPIKSLNFDLIQLELFFSAAPSLVFNELWLFNYMTVLSCIIYQYHLNLHLRLKPNLTEIIRCTVASLNSDLYDYNFRINFSINNNYLNNDNNVITVSKLFFEHFIQLCLIVPKEIIENHRSIISALNIEDKKPMETVMDILNGEHYNSLEMFKNIWKRKCYSAKSTLLKDINMVLKDTFTEQNVQPEISLHVITELADHLFN